MIVSLILVREKSKLTKRKIISLVDTQLHKILTEIQNQGEGELTNITTALKKNNTTKGSNHVKNK